MARSRVNWTDLGGGQNDTLSPSVVPHRQMQAQLNMVIARSRGSSGLEVVPREGAKPYGIGVQDEKFYGAMGFFSGADVLDDQRIYRLFGFGDGFIKRATAGDYALHTTNGFTLGVILGDGENRPWRSVVTSQGGTPIGLACNVAALAQGWYPGAQTEASRLLRITTNDAQVAGMIPPGTAPVVTDIGGGTLPDGVWIGAVRFMGTGNNRSEMGPTFTVTIASGGTGKRSYAGIPISGDPQCRGREVFLSEADGARTFSAFTILDNVTVAYTESIDDEELGAEAPPTGSHGLPPTGPIDVTIWRSRTWLLTKLGCFPSQTFDYESFNPTEAVSINTAPNALSEFVGICAWDQRERMIIAKSGSVHYLVPAAGATGITQWQVKDLDPEEGCASTYSLDSGGGRAFWYTGRHVKMTDGGRPEVISDDIQNSLDLVPINKRDRVVGCCDVRYRLYLLSLPVTVNGVDSFRTLAYDWEAGVWYRFSWFGNDVDPRLSPLFLSKVQTSVTTPNLTLAPGEIAVYGSFDMAAKQRLFDVLYPGQLRDDTSNIERVILTGGVTGEDGERIFAMAAYLKIRNRTGGSLPSTTVTVSLLSELGETTRRTVPLPDLVSSLKAREFQRLAATNKRNPGTWVALRISIDGFEQIAISGLGLDVCTIKGRTGRAL